MRVKKSDIFKIIQEELEAVKRALPAWLGEEVEDEDVFFDQDYDAGFKGGGEGSSTSQTLAYQLGAFDRENGLEHNPSEHPPRGPTAKGERHGTAPEISTQGTAGKSGPAESVGKQRDYSWNDSEEPDDHPYAYKDPDDPYAREKEEKEKSIPAYNPDSRRQQLQKRNPGRKYSLEEEGEDKYASLPQAGDPAEKARLKAQRDSAQLPEDPARAALVELGKFQAKLAVEAPELAKDLDQVIVQMQKAGLTQGYDQKGLDEAELKPEPGMQVRDIRDRRVATVTSVKAGPGGVEAIVKLEDGTTETWRPKYLEPVGGVEEVMIGDRWVDDGPGWQPPLKPEFNAMSLEDKQDVLEKSKTYHRENRGEWDPEQESSSGQYIGYMIDTIEKEEAAAVTEGGAVGDTGDPYKQGDPSVRDGWQEEDLIGFLQKYPSGVTAKDLAMAFGGQWQTHAAKLQKLVTQGTLKKGGNKYVLADVNETLRDIFGLSEEYEDDDELADLYDEFPELRQDAAAAGDVPADVASQLADEFGSDEEEDEDDIYERLRSKAMRQLEGHPQGKLPRAPDADIPQEDVERVISFLQDQRDAGVGELDLGSIMQDMGMELNTVKLIMVDRLGYNIEPSESDPRGKIFFDRPVGASRPEPGENTMSEEHEPGHEEGAVQHYQEAATSKLREHVGRFMKVTLREEARNK